MCFALLLLLYHPLSQPVWIRLSVRYFAYVCVGFEMHTVSRLHTAVVVDLRISLLLARLATTIPDIYEYYYNCTACGHHSESFRKSASGGNTAALLCFFCCVLLCWGGRYYRSHVLGFAWGCTTKKSAMTPTKTVSQANTSMYVRRYI